LGRFSGPLFLFGATVLAASAFPVQAQVNQAQVKTFNIPAQSAQSGIPQFAQQADLQILVPEKLALGQNTSTVQGTMPVQDGLRRLLTGTSLTPVTQSNGAVILVKASLQTPASADATAAIAASATADTVPGATPPVAGADATTEVVVKGTRAALMKAREIKRKAPNIIESIVAEDIGKMPDTNLAESIQRIPGVAMTREGGEGRNITLRGFSPDFTRTTLNGMEVPASSDGLDSGGVTLNAGRAFDFHVFAAELFNRIDVEKTQKASTEEGGIAGTVDLYSGRPFDYKGLTVSLNAQDDYNSLTTKHDPHLAFLISDTFFGGKLGVLFSAAMANRTVYQEGYSSVRWESPYQTGDSWNDAGTTVKGTPSDYCGAADALNCLWAPRLPRADFFGNDQKRVGFTGSVQYRPADNILITLDALHSNLLNDRYSANSMEWLLTHGVAGNYTGQTPLSFTVGSDGTTIEAASFNDVTSWYESRHQKSNSNFNQLVLSGKIKLTDKLTIDAMTGVASDHADRTELRFYSRSIPHYYAYDYTTSGNPYVPVISFGSYDPNNFSNYVSGLTAANQINHDNKDNITTKLDATYRDQTFSLKAGIDYNDRKVAFDQGNGSFPSFVPTAYLEAFPYSDFGKGLPGGASLQAFPMINFDAIAKAGIVSTNYVIDPSLGWKVGEETYGGYVEANAEHDIAGMPFRANAGLRYVKTNVTSQAVVSGTPVEQKNSYDNWLPSMNLALDVRDDVVARFSAGRSMTRPGLSSLNISGPVFGYTTRTVGNIGNPDLKPYESNDMDVSLEWYLGKEGLISVGVFNKDIIRSLKTEVVTKMIDPSFWAAIYADPKYDASYNADPAKVPYTFTIPVNDDTGNNVNGIELTYNQGFTFLPGALKNLGIASNYTHVTAKDSTGLSPNSYNVTLYYETKAYGVRFSLNKRDDYLLSEPGGNGSVQERKYGPTHVDFSSFYNINKNLTLTFEGINITDEVERIYDTGDTGTMDLTREYTHTGAQWLVGIRYRN
jgi:TonB-dependent receptor